MVNSPPQFPFAEKKPFVKIFMVKMNGDNCFENKNTKN